MAYLALYREWRPKNFKDMVGQEHVTKTLTNALKQHKVAHAYLFSGPRGTGKTTTAKVLAKALNCENRDGIEPCNHCSSCLSIDQGNAMEVLEIDAASNRGIDEIRDLREKVRLSAAQEKYKVYIIDEVHMLTPEAFNALLKTLEEPPERVVFILATTEVHKIPLTILSRVQRFEFHRIPLDQIQSRLAEVCAAKGRNVTADALMTIAQKSEGGLRDALSILDQCLLLEGDIGVEQVYQVLGMVGEEYSSQLFDILLISDYSRALSLLNQGINQGRDPRQILRELLEYLRLALIYASTHQVPYIAPHLKDKLILQSETAGVSRLLQWIYILLQGESQLKYAANARLAAEMLLIQMIYEVKEEVPANYRELGERITRLEQDLKRLASGWGQGFQVLQGETSFQNRTQAAQDNSAEQTTRGNSLNYENQPNRAGQFKQTAHSVNPNESSSGIGESVHAPSSQGLNIAGVQAKWAEVLEQVRKLKRSTHAFLMEGKPMDVNGQTLFIVFKDGFSFHRDKVDQTENRKTIEKVLHDVFGTPLVLHNLIESEWEKLKPHPDQKGDNPVIKKAEDLFGADLVIVKE